MRVPVRRQEIRRILGGRYEKLHKDFLGMDISRRNTDPIYRNVYYVSYRDPIGWKMYWIDAPALCDYRSGNIYCYHDLSLPLNEARLVHEFIHRAARFCPSIGVWSSGVAVNRAWERINEGLTEYLTGLICGTRYHELTSQENRYRIYLPAIRRLEEETGRNELVRIYMEHDVGRLMEYVTPAGESGFLRFR